MMPKILVVDDEKSIVLALEDSLLDDGYEVFVASSGDEAWWIFEKEKCDVVLSDMKMPGMGGIELLAKIRAYSSTVQVIIITAYGNVDDAVDAVRLGAFDFVQKPFQIASIKELVKNALNKKKSLETAPGQHHEAFMTAGNASKNITIKDQLLPDGESSLSGISVDLKSLPLEGIGADFYDYFALDEHTVVCVIGDVGEKGLEGSLVMIMVKSLIRAEAAHCSDPVQIIASVNRHIRSQGIVSIPITLFLGIIDQQNRTITYVNAGHELPVIVSADNEPVMIPGNGIFIGLFDDPELSKATISYSIGDVIVFFTDGLVRLLEKNSKYGDPYEYLISLIKKHVCEKKYSLAETLYECVREDNNRRDDDITVMSVCLGTTVCTEKSVRCVCDAQSAVIIRAAVEELIRSAQVGYTDRHAIITAVYEAVLNAHLFAYLNADIVGELEVRSHIAEKTFFIEIKDFGKGFDMASYQPPDNESYEGLIRDSGRGIYLMHQLMDRVEITSEQGKGTCVVLEKKLKGCSYADKN